MAAKLLAPIGILAEEVVEIVGLEDVVVTQHPVVLLTDERLEHHGSEVGVIARRQHRADVMHQGADDIFLVHAGPVGAGGGLQAVLQPVDQKAVTLIPEQRQLAHQPVGQALGEVMVRLRDRQPVGPRRLGHRAKARALRRGR